MSNSKLYSNDSIQSLTPMEHVQLRPGMYCGDTSTPNQLLLELFSNSLDEHNIGHGDVIWVTIDDDGICSVRDEAQGFVIGDSPDNPGKTILQAAFDTMNTSGKYTDDGVYGGAALGLNGIGLKIITFLSKWVDIQTFYSGQKQTIRFENGVFVESETEKSNEHSGTYVRYKPDGKYFGTDKTSVNYFRDFFNDITCLCPNLTVYLNDEKISHNSIDDLIARKIGKSVDIISNHFSMDDGTINAAITFTNSSSSDIIAYVNYGLTKNGPHITGIKSNITRILNGWARENDILKDKDKNLDGSSIQEGMLFVCNINSKGVGYNAQVKTDIVKMDTSFLSSFGTEFELWLDSNPDDARAILEKAIVARKAAEAAKKAREAVKKKADNKNKVFKMPTKLSDCWTKNRIDSELLVCEGLSAASGLVAARNSEYQAVYGVRGI